MWETGRLGMSGCESCTEAHRLGYEHTYETKRETDQRLGETTHADGQSEESVVGVGRQGQ